MLTKLKSWLCYFSNRKKGMVAQKHKAKKNLEIF